MSLNRTSLLKYSSMLLLDTLEEQQNILCEKVSMINKISPNKQALKEH